MKLIDILNLIAKGELEERTKIKWGDDVYEDVKSLWADMYFGSLNEEVEIIGHDTNVATKIEEITLEKSDLACQGIHAGDLFRNIECKLNEVIRELNRRNE